MKKLIFLALFIAIFRLAYSQTDSLIIDLQRDVLSAEQLNKDVNKNEIEIVSASRTAKSVSDLPITVYVITRDEILRNGYVTLTDVIKSIPGVRTSQPFSAEAGEGFLLRGLRGNSYVKILLNNLPLCPSVTSEMPIGSQIPIRQAERIEIVYGPASAVYGADAAAGVINIITKTSADNLFAQADVVVGDNGYQYQNFMVGGKAGLNKRILQYSIYGSQMNFEDMNIVHNNKDLNSPITYMKLSPEFALDGLDIDLLTESFIQEVFGITGEEFIQQGMGFNTYEGTLEKATFDRLPQSSRSIGVDLKFKRFRFSYDYMYRKMHSSVGRSYLLYNYNDPDIFWGETIQRYTANYTIEKKRVSLSTSISYLKYRLDNRSSRKITYRNDAAEVYLFAASDDIFGEQLIILNPIKNLEITIGGSFKYSGCLPTTNELTQPFDISYYKAFSTDSIPADPVFGSFGFNPKLYFDHSSFTQIFYTLNKFSLIAGIRQDNSDIYGESINPRLATIYKFNSKISVRGSLGYAFRAPSPTIVYYSVAMPSNHSDDKISYEYIPNEDLEAEIFHSYEVGGRLQFSDNISLDISAYLNNIRNLISTSKTKLDLEKYPNADTYGNPNVSVRTNRNSGDAKSRLFGVQCSFLWTDLIPEINLDVELNYSHTNGSEVLPEKLEMGGQPPEDPNNPNPQDTIFSDQVEYFRGLSPNTIQLNISMNPFENLHINIENLWMDSWYRSFLPRNFKYREQFAIIDGYYNMDISSSYKISRTLTGFVKITNVFNSEYGGIDATTTDIDLLYNPQLKRNIRFGISFRLE